jgi:hypothetical protein
MPDLSFCLLLRCEPAPTKHATRKMPPRSELVPTAQPSRLPSYAMAASRTALSLIIEASSTADNVDEEGNAAGNVDNRSFEAVEQSASEVLLDVFTRYMRSLGTAARNTAQHAGRSESNLMDMLQALHTSGAGCTPGDLLAFLNEAPEVAFPCNLSASFPVPREPLSATVAASTATGPESRPPYVPDFLPAFPEKRTYSHTATHNCRVADPPAAKKRRSKHRRQAQESLLALAEAGASGATTSDALAATSSSVAPPPPLPSIADADEPGEVQGIDEAGNGNGAHRQRRSEGALALGSVPDVLAASFPAVLQSSARLESSGCIAGPFGLPAAPGTSAREAETAQQAAAAAIEAAAPRQAAVLSLKHLNRLEEIKEERGGAAAAANAADE